MSTAGERILQSAKQALDFATGENIEDCKVHIPQDIDVCRIREKLDMKQKAFADYFGFSLRTLQEWEQGRRVPTGATRNFLYIIDREPELVRNALVQSLPPQDHPPAP